MKNKIILFNLGILFTYLIFLIGGIKFFSKSGNDILAMLIYCMVVILAHVGINIILAIVMFATNKKEEGKLYLLSILLIGVIGFPACWGGAAII